jgi:hypothetical protein
MGKRKRGESQVDVESLLEILSEARVYIREEYQYCI